MSRSRSTTALQPALVGAVLGLAAVTGLAATPASAVGIDSELSPRPHSVHANRTVATLDGFTIGYTPSGIGSSTDFLYEWDEVVFHSRVWETGPDAGGAYRVDVDVNTMRGAALSDLEALRGWFTEYLERDPAEWKLTPVKVGAYSGYAADDRVFYLIEPGVAAEVTIDRSRFSKNDLMRTARGFQPA